MRPDDSGRPKDWFEHADADLEAARILFKHGRNPAVAAMHIQQAAEKALKGFLVAHGWRLRRTHDLIQLLNQAVKHDSRFEKYRRFCEEATAYFFEARYPLFISKRAYTKKEVHVSLKTAVALVHIAQGSEEE
jgi:HEPN domain-containing protein